MVNETQTMSKYEDFALEFARIVEKQFKTTVCYDAQPILIEMLKNFAQTISDETRIQQTREIMNAGHN